MPQYLGLCEFDGEETPVSDVTEIMRNEKVADGAMQEAGWFRLKRVYGGESQA